MRSGTTSRPSSLGTCNLLLLLLAFSLFTASYAAAAAAAACLDLRRRPPTPRHPAVHPSRSRHPYEDWSLHDEQPSMITAIAPATMVAAYGGAPHETVYAIHYHEYFVRTRQGRGVFDRRGVFANDPPIATCTPCGGGVGLNGTEAMPSCSTTVYDVSLVFSLPGVFMGSFKGA